MTAETVRLADCCEIVSGATPRRDHPEYWGGDIAWVTPKDIRDLDGAILADTPEHITKAGYESCSTHLLPEGSVLFSSRAPIGLVAVTGREMCTNQGFKSLIPGPDVDAGYLYWCLKREAPRIAAKSSGTTFTEISRKGMEQVKIPLPPLPEQRRIAAILDKTAAVRRKREQTLDLADQFLRSVFLDLFGDPVTNPRGWPVKKLQELIDPERPITYGILKPGPDEPEGVPYVRVVDMADEMIKVHALRRTTREIAEKYRRSKLQKVDVLLSIRGHVGRLALVPAELAGANITQDTARLAASPDILPEYLLGALSTSGLQQWMARCVKGGAVKGINLGDVKMIPIAVPPRDKQERFAQTYRAMRSVRVLEVKLVGRLDALHGSLTQRAFRGDI